MSRSVRRTRLVVDGELERLTHYLFRYPAKFHPPVVRALLERYTTKGDLVLDPFCGSGTLLVEASVLGRHSIGIDVDPVAVLVAQAKVHRYRAVDLQRSVGQVLDAIRSRKRPAADYERLMLADLTDEEFEQEIRQIAATIPPIPNLFHWFRKYVIVDLAWIRQTLHETAIPESHRKLIWVAFASIIRNCSNADPVPVSGLEVTSYMKARDAAGRLIDPYTKFEKALIRAAEASTKFQLRVSPGVRARVRTGDATRLDARLGGYVDALITSPPYHGAVDYYRRHKLEMFWLGQTKTAADRLALLPKYIGRPQVPQSHPYVANSLTTSLAKRWEDRIRRLSASRANAFRHYLTAMASFFEGVAPYLPAGSPAILVVGHSTWNRSHIPTTDLFAEIAGDNYALEEVLWYPVKNRYMSYSRRNSANIDREYVLVFSRARGTPSRNGSGS